MDHAVSHGQDLSARLSRARDGLLVHGYLTLPLGSTGKNLPLVVVTNSQLHFRPGAARLHMGSSKNARQSRSYAVLGLNPRGTPGYGKAFLRCRAAPGRPGHRERHHRRRPVDRGPGHRRSAAHRHHRHLLRRIFRRIVRTHQHARAVSLRRDRPRRVRLGKIAGGIRQWARFLQESRLCAEQRIDWISENRGRRRENVRGSAPRYLADQSRGPDKIRGSRRGLQDRVRKLPRTNPKTT